MSEGKRYYWLRLHDDFFDSKRIKKLRRMAGGDTYTIIYLKMQLLAINTDGIIKWTGLEESIAEELALDLDESVDDVKVTLTYLLHCGLCETSDNINFFLPYAIENTGSETSSTQRSREFRAKQKALQCNTDATESVAMQHKCNTNATESVAMQHKCNTNATESVAMQHKCNTNATESVAMQHKCNTDATEMQRNCNASATESNSNSKRKEIEKEIEVEVVEEDGCDCDTDCGKLCGKLETLGGSIGQGVVNLSEDQMNDLLEQLGLDMFNYYCKRLSDYIIAKDAHIKSHYNTILKWYKEDSRCRST